MVKSNKFQCLLLIVICLFAMTVKAQRKRLNIIIVYADDLGYGDLSCYGAIKISTPHIDALAEKGLRFTNAHSSSSICTPSRYSLLTGKYAWRQKGTGIANGDAPLLTGLVGNTLPAMLQKAGYATGVIGKWHLGLGGTSGPDWNGLLKPGPQEVGFDYHFIIPATADRVPCVFVENQHVVNADPADPIHVNYQHKIGVVPTGSDHPELLKMGADPQHSGTIVDSISRIGYMSGGEKASWNDQAIAATLTHKAFAFIDEHVDKPFFLYFASHDIHVPRVPQQDFVGRSGMGPRGDAILQLDWTVGQLTSYLKSKGLLEQTIIIFSSDNGPVLHDGYQDGAVSGAEGHAAAGPYRGGKYSSYEGGTRVPFIIRWPGSVGGKSSGTLISQLDLYASFASLLQQKLMPGEAPDSFNMLGTLKTGWPGSRKILVEHAMNDNLSLIWGNWKYCQEGNTLYHLSKDPSESKNLGSKHPKKLKEMSRRLQQIINRKTN